MATDGGLSPEASAALAWRTSGIAGGIVLALWRQGLLPEDSAEAFAESLRDIARIAEAAGYDDAASQAWTVANLLRRRPPTDRE